MLYHSLIFCQKWFAQAHSSSGFILPSSSIIFSISISSILPGDFETSKSFELSSVSPTSSLCVGPLCWSCSLMRDFLFDVRMVELYLFFWSPITSRSIESSSISRLFSCAIDGFMMSAVLSLVLIDYMPIMVADDSMCVGDTLGDARSLSLLSSSG